MPRERPLRRENATENQDSEPNGEVAYSVFARSKFYDSGVGSSLPAATAYAATIISYISSFANGSGPRTPPLSEEVNTGQPSECDACGNAISKRTNREWRKNLFHDLQRRTCFYQNCSFNSSALLERDSWINHLAGHMEDIALAALPKGTDSGVCYDFTTMSRINELITGTSTLDTAWLGRMAN
ncbi:hypothetical protein K432DRAFT_402228 [Lepidopterella palustris CBS 459.81]|uniref:Uncharacterized protein n=1 Tax=Lepidopterella palustris CBS 459.81 TaxID=1314670 RepID=A0A8E2EGA4_9PEZI|nr:hypothetical protein K432DRAFT_402228 [Lepidopterella palustris CBS 459.81]